MLSWTIRCQRQIQVCACITWILKSLFQRRKFLTESMKGFLAFYNNSPRNLVFGHFKVYLYIAQRGRVKGNFDCSGSAVAQRHWGMADNVAVKVLMQLSCEHIFEHYARFYFPWILKLRTLPLIRQTQIQIYFLNRVLSVIAPCRCFYNRKSARLRSVGIAYCSEIPDFDVHFVFAWAIAEFFQLAWLFFAFVYLGKQSIFSLCYFVFCR